MSYARRRRRLPAEQGAALVEFALVLPIFALMLFAMVQFGVMFAGWAQLRNAVQTGARMTAIGQVSTECGPLSQPDCTVAVQIGTPVGLTSPSQPVTSLAIPGTAQCHQDLSSCADYSWLDGYYIEDHGTWAQIVSPPPSPSPPPAGQVPDQEAFRDGAGGTWKCTGTDSSGNCTQLSTSSSAGTSAPALGSDYNDITVSCAGSPSTTARPHLEAPPASCPTNSQLLVSAQLSMTSFSGLFPGLAVPTRSAFYVETATATPANQQGGSPPNG